PAHAIPASSLPAWRAAAGPLAGSRGPGARRPGRHRERLLRRLPASAPRSRSPARDARGGDVGRPARDACALGAAGGVPAGDGARGRGRHPRRPAAGQRGRHRALGRAARLGDRPRRPSAGLDRRGTGLLLRDLPRLRAWARAPGADERASLLRGLRARDGMHPSLGHRHRLRDPAPARRGRSTRRRRRDRPRRPLPRMAALGRLIAFALALVLVAAPAEAHGNWSGGGFYAGLLQPIYHPEALLAALALVLWSTQQEPSAGFLVCAAFTATIALGSSLALLGARIPGAEWGTRAAMLAFGPLAAARLRLPGQLGAALAAAAGLAS